MTKIIEGKNAVMGRLASYAAKEALKGEEIVIVNCDQVIITGKKEFIKRDLEEKRKRMGTIQKGPKISRSSDKIVKRAIRGMLPNYRQGRGRVAWKKIKCYIGVPKKFQETKKISFVRDKKVKSIQVKELRKLQNKEEK